MQLKGLDAAPIIRKDFRPSIWEFSNPDPFGGEINRWDVHERYRKCDNDPR